MKFNDQIYGELTSHSILLLDYIRWLQKEISKKTFQGNNALKVLLMSHLSSISRSESLNNKNWRDFAKSLKTIRNTLFSALTLDIENRSSAFLREESRYIVGLFKEISPVYWKWKQSADKKAESIPSFGMTISERMRGIVDNDYKKILIKTKSLFQAGYPIQTIIASILGAKSRNYAGSSVGISNNHVRTTISTTISGIAESSLRGFSSANQDVLGLYGDSTKQEVFVAILDSHTTIRCMNADGNIYPLEEGLFPPLHYGCRSRRYPVINGIALANGRIFYYKDGDSYIKKDFVADAKKKYKDWTAKSKRTQNAIIDSMRKDWAKKFVGGVPNNYNYETFLQNQSEAFQNRVLGKKRAELFRLGNLNLNSFSDSQGRVLTLRQLFDLYSESFSIANIKI